MTRALYSAVLALSVFVCTTYLRRGWSGTEPPSSLDVWSATPVIQPEGDSLAVDVTLPRSQVVDSGIKLWFGAPSRGDIPSIGFLANRFSFAMVWWSFVVSNNGKQAANVQIGMGYAPGSPFQPGEPVFPTLSYGGHNRLAEGGLMPPNPPLVTVSPGGQAIVSGFARTLDIEPIAKQYPEVLTIQRLIGRPGSVGPGVWRGGGKSIPTIRFALWCDSNQLTLRAGSYAAGLLVPVHPELISGNGNGGVSLGTSA